MCRFTHCDRDPLSHGKSKFFGLNLKVLNGIIGKEGAHQIFDEGFEKVSWFAFCDLNHGETQQVVVESVVDVITQTTKREVRLDLEGEDNRLRPGTLLLRDSELCLDGEFLDLD